MGKLIDSDDLKLRLKNLHLLATSGYGAEEVVGKVIDEMPSAQPERKTGRWEYVDYGGFGNWHCTACHQICICNGDYDFCPNCGARMTNGE